MTQTFVLLEKVIRRAPLGVRFLDLVRGTPVADGLRVRAWPVGQPGQAALLQRGAVSDVYGVRTLPGFRPYEVGDAPATDWCAPPEAGVEEADEANWVLYVEDALGRFVPQARLICLPKETLLQIELASGPARAGVGGFIQVVGELRERAADRPAAWALVSTADEAYVTIADGRGMFALYMPIPAPPANSSSTTSLNDVTWDLAFRVRYEPGAQRAIVGAEPPDTMSITEQGFATLYSSFDPAHPDDAVSGQTLTRPWRLGQDLVLRTEGPSQARLLLDPA